MTSATTAVVATAADTIAADTTAADATAFFFIVRLYGKNQCCQCVKSHCETNKSSGGFHF